MTRRALILGAVAAGVVGADAEDETWELVASAARALVEATALRPPYRSPVPFLSYFDPKMAGFETLRDNVTALIDQVDLQSTIDPLRNEGNDRAREMTLDWLLTMSDPGSSIVSTRREAEIRCRVEKQGKKWRIVSLEPVSFFAAPHA